MKKLRIKIVLGVFLSATVVLMLTVLLVGIGLGLEVDQHADSMTQMIVNNGGTMPEHNDENYHNRSAENRMYGYDEESPYRMRYFVVRYENNEIKTIDLEHIASVTEEEAKGLANEVSWEYDSTGYYDNYRYRIASENGMMVFLDSANELYAVRYIILMLMVIALFFILMITVVFHFLSKLIVKPFIENNKMQKRFITDASHELKTPIAIIAANAEVLAYKDGENEWINNITSQVQRISELVNELLTLNRLDEVETVTDIKPVDLTETVTKTSASFEEVLKNKHTAFTQEIQPEVVLNGNQMQLERLVSVLVENATKYVSEGGEVVITLKKGQRFTFFSVFNTCEIDNKAEFSHLFDRFYRPDSSRTSKTGGHGIGLSIAKRIVELHNGTIEAIPSDKGLTFQVKLSNRLKTGKKRQT